MNNQVCTANLSAVVVSFTFLYSPLGWSESVAITLEEKVIV